MNKKDDKRGYRTASEYAAAAAARIQVRGQHKSSYFFLNFNLENENNYQCRKLKNSY